MVKESKVKKKIYVFDIDGTICNDTNGKYREAKPYIERIKKVNELYNKGNFIVFQSARGQTTKKDWFDLTIKQFKKWGVKYHALSLDKIDADYFIDDKGVHPNVFFNK